MNVTTAILAVKTIPQIVKMISDFVNEKKEKSKMLDMATSHVGKAILERKEAELVRVRARYIKLPNDGNAESIIRKLVAVQTLDTYIEDEINGIKNIKKESKRLDTALELCHSVLKMREAKEKTTR